MDSLFVSIVFFISLGTFLSVFFKGKLFRIVFFSLYCLLSLALLDHLITIWNITYEEYWEVSDNALRGIGIVMWIYVSLSASIYLIYLFNLGVKLFHFSRIDKYLLGFFILSNLTTISLLYIAESNIPIE